MRAFVRSALAAIAASLALLAATPAPHATPVRIDVTKLVPKVPLHTEYIVAINKLGQVTRVVSGKTSKDRTFNMQTFGNAMQAFIRTTDNKAIPGKYRLSYDYSPKTMRVHRGVALVSQGGVDPNAEGAVYRMMDDVKKHGKAPPAAATPKP